MKRLINRSVWLAPVLVLLSSSVALDFYDPRLQRWINRDPLGDSSFMSAAVEPVSFPARLMAGEALGNLYSFLENCPTSGVDPFGLKGAKEPPKDEPKCYTKNDIPKEIKDKLSEKQKQRLQKSCWTLPCTHIVCCPGILAGGGVLGGLCVKCSF